MTAPPETRGHDWTPELIMQLAYFWRDACVDYHEGGEIDDGAAGEYHDQLREAIAALTAQRDALREALEKFLQWETRAADFHEDYQSPSFLKSCGRDVDTGAEATKAWLERVLIEPARTALASGRPAETTT